MSDLNVKVGLIGKFDMLKFKNMSKVREKAIQAAPAKEISGVFPVNENAKALHPDFLELEIESIIQRNAAKTFVLKGVNGKPLPYFRAGQYISLKLPMDGSLVTRSYSLCSSPKEALSGKYAITVRANPGGFAANRLLSEKKIGDRIICDGIEDFELTLLYGSRTEADILFRGELDEIARVCPKFKVVHVLSDEKKEGFEHGFITAELIGKYAPEEYSVFLCGPEAMYKFLKPEIEKLGLPERLFRRKLIDVTKTPWECEGYPQEVKGKQFTITVRQGPQECSIPANADEPVLVAIERAGIKAPSRCRAGECGWCRSRLLVGTVFIPQENEMRRWADVHYGYIHPCCSFPTSDLTIEIPGEFF